MIVQPRALLLCLAVAATGCATSKHEERQPDPSPVSAPASSDGKPAQAGEAVVDAAYGFQLARPSPDWILQNYEQMRRIAPAARAGALNMSGYFGAIVVEFAGGMQLRDYAQLLLDNMPLGDKQVRAFEQVQFQGREAIRFAVQGTVEGMPILYENTVFLHQGFGYQLLGWTATSRAQQRPDWFAPFLAAFSVLPGEVKGDDSAAPVTADQVGPGWRIRDGVFESAALGLSVAPPDRWRLVVGQELRKMNSQAEIGVEHLRPDLYAVVLGERTSKKDRKAQLEALERESTSGMAVTRGAGDVHAQVGGRSVTFRRYKGAPNRPVDMLYGLHCEGELCFQLITWRLGTLTEADLQTVKALLAEVKFLDEAARRRVAAELEKEPDPQTALGATWTYRQGRYVDFANALSWRRPGGFWRVATGDEAAELGEAIDLFLTEPVKGVYALVMKDEPQSETPSAHHDLIAQLVLGDAERRPPKELRLGKVNALQSEASLPSDMGGFLRYRVVTAVHEGHAWRIVFWGRPLDMVEGARTVDEALAAFDLSAPAMIDQAGRARTDRRLGFRYEPPEEGWRVEEITPEHLKSRGTVTSFRRGAEGVMVLAVHAQGAQDPEWFPSFVSEMFQRVLRKKVDAQPVRREVQLSGRKAEHLSFPGGALNSDIFLTRDGHVFYALIVMTDRAEPRRLSELSKGFSVTGW